MEISKLRHKFLLKMISVILVVVMLTVIGMMSPYAFIVREDKVLAQGAATANLEPIFFTKQNGDAAEPEIGTFTIPNVYVDISDFSSGISLLDGKLVFAAYDSKSDLCSISIVKVHQNVPRAIYSGKEFYYSKGGCMKVYLWGGQDGMVPLADSVSYNTAVVPYSRTPDFVASDKYTLTVNGKPIDVERFADLSCSRFSFSGTAKITISSQEAINTFSILPGGYNITGTIGNKTLSFSIDQQRYLVITINNSDKLLLFADNLELDAPDPLQANVINIKDYLSPTRDNNVPVTEQLKAAIEDTSNLHNKQGGILYIPDGKYVATQLPIKSNVHLYLESGALLKAAIDFNTANYPLQSASGDSSFLYMLDAQNVKISGRGIIDGDGYNGRTIDDNFNIKLIRTVKSKNIQIKDVYLEDSAKWTVHLAYSDDVETQNIKIINDLRGSMSGTVLIPVVRNTDGVVIDASRSVAVEGCFFYTGDDAVTPKVSNIMNLKRSCYDMTIRNNVIYTLKAALKVGDETSADIYNITFDNNEVVNADRFIALWVGDICHLHDVYASNNRSDFIGGDFERRYFTFKIYFKNANSKPGRISNVHINNLTGSNDAQNSSVIQGYDSDHIVSGVTFNNVVINGKKVLSKDDIPLTYLNSYYSDIFYTGD